MSALPHRDHVSDQERVLEFLGAGSGEDETRRVDTHASTVFLKPDRVYKIKRAVRLPYLDYSTLEKRRRACEEEVAVNRRYAPKLYRRVVPITDGAKGPEIGGKGDVIEWAVEMARFDERQTFDHLAARDRIAPQLVEQLAGAICTAHQNSETSAGREWLASLPRIIDRNTEAFRVQPTFDTSDVERLHAASVMQFTSHLPLLRRRAAAGRVRRCHGDAHLANIALIDDRPVLFDAIEFDPVIATTDVLYDLAFPLMDLLHFDQYAAANRLLNGYLEQTWSETAETLCLLPLFLSIRAAIRANVLLIRYEQSNGNAALLAEARAYFALALSLMAPGKPHLFAIGGRSGTGKSVLAHNIAARTLPLPGAVLLRSDVIRKELFGIAPLVPLPETAYAPAITERVYRVMLERAQAVLAQGFSVVLDAAFLKESERALLPPLATATGVPYSGVFLFAETSVRLARIAARHNDASDASRDVALFQDGIDCGRIDWTAVDAGGTPEQTLERAIHWLPQAALRKCHHDAGCSRPAALELGLQHIPAGRITKRWALRPGWVR